MQHHTRLMRLRFRRRLRKGQRQVEDLGLQAEHGIEEHLFKRFDRLANVQRFMLGWITLLLLVIAGLAAQNLALSGYYQTVKTVPGGIYNEGVLGRFTNANPLYATSDADTTVSRLLFAGLLKIDDEGKLVGDLASGYSVDARGATYTVHLKPGLTWQDGRPLTSADVVFTYQLAQNPDVRSPLQYGWKGIAMAAPDARTVVFTLPDALASFPYSLTTGIVPRHLLKDIPAADLRSADFNTVQPIGAGPFSLQAIQVSGNGNPQKTQQQMALMPFEGYNGGKPKLQKFVVQVFANESDMIRAFDKRQLNAIAGLHTVPDQLRDHKEVIEHNLTLRAANMVFFKTTSGVLADKSVRRALVQATDVPSIVQNLDYPVRLVRQPLLIGQLGYDPNLNQLGFDNKAAAAALAGAGWQPSKKDGIRQKDGRPLKFTLTAADTPESKLVTRQLKWQWRAIGVHVDVLLQDATDFQNSLNYHNYDAILNGIAIGADPDVFVYWDSSQADIRSSNRLNLSEYKNPTADIALEAGRTRVDPALRTIKYKPFLQAWQDDNPALGLYQPRMLYLTNGQIGGLGDYAINHPADRFNNVHNWQIREARVTN